MRRRVGRITFPLGAQPARPARQVAETVGARTPGVQTRRMHEARKVDWGTRLRESLRGGQPPTIWR